MWKSCCSVEKLHRRVYVPIDQTRLQRNSIFHTWPKCRRHYFLHVLSALAELLVQVFFGVCIDILVHNIYRECCNPRQAPIILRAIYKRQTLSSKLLSGFSLRKVLQTVISENVPHEPKSCPPSSLLPQQEWAFFYCFFSQWWWFIGMTKNRQRANENPTKHPRAHSKAGVQYNVLQVSSLPRKMTTVQRKVRFVKKGVPLQ